MPRHPVVTVLRGAAWGVGIGLAGTGATAVVLSVQSALGPSPAPDAAYVAGLGFSAFLFGLSANAFLWASQ